MKHLLTATLALSTPAVAGDWSAEDTKWQAAYIALHVADWGQTRDIAAKRDRYFEQNPVLGKHPSVKRVDSYFLATSIAHTAISYALPPDLRRRWQQITVVVQAGVVAHNYGIGLNINFK